MSDLFDKNGNATETYVVTVHGFDSETREFVGTYDVRIFAGTGIPRYSTLTEPPTAESGHAICWDGAAWQQIIDLRGNTVYEIATGNEVRVKLLGPLSNELTAIEPTTSYDKWDGAQWVTDSEAAKKAAIVEAELGRSSLLVHADEIMRDWRDELALGLISASDKEKLTQWLAYKKQVKAVDISTAFIWPTPPAQ